MDKLNLMQEMELGSNASPIIIAQKAENVEDVASGADAAALRTTVNAILASLREAGIMDGTEPTT